MGLCVFFLDADFQFKYLNIHNSSLILSENDILLIWVL